MKYPKIRLVPKYSEEFKKGFRAGEKSGISKATEALSAACDLALSDIGASQEIITAFEKKFNQTLSSVCEDRIDFNDVMDAKEEEVG